MIDSKLIEQHAAERDRLRNMKGDLFTKIAELEEQVKEIDRHLAAYDAFDAALSGKAPSAPAPSKARAPRTAPDGRNEGIRGKILAIIAEKPEGMVAAEIKAAVEAIDPGMGTSVANALSNLKTAGKITQEKPRAPYKVAA